MSRRTRTSSSGPSSGAQSRAGLLATAFEAKTKTRTALAEVPAAWLATLLTMSCDLPIEEGPEAVATAIVEAVGAILTEHAFGMSLNEPFEPHRPEGGRFLRSAPQGSQVGLSPSPGRLFPEFAHERVLDMSGEYEGIR